MAKIKPLRKSMIFSHLSDKELAIFSRIVSEEMYEEGTVLYAEKMKSDKFYLIEKGKVVISTAGREAGADIELGEGESFGEFAVIGPSHLTTVTARVVEEAYMLVIKRNDFDDFAESEPGIALRIYREMLKSAWVSVEEVQGLLHERL